MGLSSLLTRDSRGPAEAQIKPQRMQIDWVRDAIAGALHAPPICYAAAVTCQLAASFINSMTLGGVGATL